VEPNRARWAGGTLLAVVAVALLIPVVALASRPEDAGGIALHSADPARLLLDVASYLFAVFVVLSLIIIIWALWPRPNEELPALPPRQRRVLSTVLTAILLVAIAIWLRSTGRLGPRQNLTLGGGAGGLPPGSLPGHGGGAPPGFDWLAAGIVVGLLVAGAVVTWWFLRPRRPAAALSLARLQAVLDDAIDDVLGEADPRRAVIAAWSMPLFGISVRWNVSGIMVAATTVPACCVRPVNPALGDLRLMTPLLECGFDGPMVHGAPGSGDHLIRMRRPRRARL